MREAVRETLLQTIGAGQPLTESAVAELLGANAPPPEVLRVQLQHLEIEGVIRRDNNRRFSLVAVDNNAARTAPVEQEEVEVSKTRECKTCKAVKPFDDFPQNKTCRDGIEPRCKACKKGGWTGLKKPDKKKAAVMSLPPPERGSGPKPGFLSVQTRESYVIAGDDGTSASLSAAHVEALYQWWKVKRKTK